MNSMVCMGHGPGCKNVLHNFGPLELYEERVAQRRLVRVRVDTFYMTQMLNPRPGQDTPANLIREVTSNLPADAYVVHVITDTTSPALIAFVRSKEFDVVDMGQEVPLFDVRYTRAEREVKISEPSGAPSAAELMTDLNDALGNKELGAEPITPKAVWERLLRQVRALAERQVRS